LITGESEAILFDVFMLHGDAKKIADGIAKSGKTLKTVMISHAHPDHFMGSDVITERFPTARVVSTENVVTDIKTDGKWIFSILHDKLGPERPTRLVVPELLAETDLTIEGVKLEVVEFGEAKASTLRRFTFLRSRLSFLPTWYITRRTSICRKSIWKAGSRGLMSSKRMPRIA
jgi:hypothetical protein